MSKDLKTMISVMQHFENGGDVQFAYDGGWEDMQYPEWNWEEFEYRKKPEKKKRLMTKLELLGKWLVLDENNMTYVSSINNGYIYAIDEEGVIVNVPIEKAHENGWKWNTKPTLEGAMSLEIDEDNWPNLLVGVEDDN